ncbi:MULTISPECIES: DUF4087 domain-containing protein [unclassified Bosea (in: a-proteobacteria)]|uniref:DUF4087 domain-containing protein n=1 Tax=unclassified Bosea (in: a-proteobacteria) TaxID=2653178 RepID=UPI000F75A159|nr:MULTISPECIES: DUF4087 domain-containing protein [unclassified Bosea (in: a-proteobacteria)]AZO80941.1 hypothetical protein BLM15_27775 [Bosea sp. Tri-49]
MSRQWLAAAVAAALTLGLGVGIATAQQPGREQRCGWFDNPSPGNAWLHDKDGRWTVAIQGDYQAEGDWPPVYKTGELRRQGNGNYGYGCACLTVKVDAAEKKILEIFSSKGQSLATCRKDRALSTVEKRLR